MERIKYEPEGWIDMRALIDNERLPFIFISSMRGPGKTYGAIDYALRCQNKPFILMRRTQVQADFAASPVTTPLVPNLEPDEYIEPVPTGVKNLACLRIMRRTEQDPEMVGECYVVGMSTVASMRGIDMTRCEILIYDEFQKEDHQTWLKGEYKAFRNAYETLNRNRELQGRPPLKCIALSNCLDIANPYYRGYGLVNSIYDMKGEVLRDYRQKVAIYRPFCEEFEKKKKQTALYQSDGSAETMGGEWARINREHVKSLSLRGAVPICSINGVGFYKIQPGRAYASSTAPAAVPAYNLEDKIDLAAVHKRNQGIITALFNRKVTFESVDILLRCQELVNKL